VNCPTCGRKHYMPAPPRSRVCWACGEAFTQVGSGRPRLVCDNAECQVKRRRYRRAGYAALDRLESA
jgi:hypothetical protein